MGIIDRLKKVLNRIADINMNDFDMNTKLQELELDSLERIDVVMNIEEEFDISIDDDIFEKFESVKDLVEVLNENTK